MEEGGRGQGGGGGLSPGRWPQGNLLQRGAQWLCSASCRHRAWPRPSLRSGGACYPCRHHHRKNLSNPMQWDCRKGRGRERKDSGERKRERASRAQDGWEGEGGGAHHVKSEKRAIEYPPVRQYIGINHSCRRLLMIETRRPLRSAQMAAQRMGTAQAVRPATETPVPQKVGSS